MNVKFAYYQTEVDADCPLTAIARACERVRDRGLRAAREPDAAPSKEAGISVGLIDPC